MSENMFEEEMEREDEEYHEAIKLLLMAVQAIVQVLNVLMVIIHDDDIERPLTRRPISRTGYDYINKALNTIAPDLMVQPRSTMPTKIRESTRFYPYFKDCVGAIDGTHIPAMVS
ncbi:hypothetical protein TB2_044998 [Malus domestica]